MDAQRLAILVHYELHRAGMLEFVGSTKPAIDCIAETIEKRVKIGDVVLVHDSSEVPDETCTKPPLAVIRNDAWACYNCGESIQIANGNPHYDREQKKYKCTKLRY